MDIRNKVAIIGTGCSRFGERYEASREDLICEAAFEAYADAGIEPKQIEAAWLGVQFSGQSATPLGDALKLFDIPMTRVENYCASGMDAVRSAAIAIAAGLYDVVLALGYEKMRDGGFGRPYKSHPLKNRTAGARLRAHRKNTPGSELPVSSNPPGVTQAKVTPSSSVMRARPMSVFPVPGGPVRMIDRCGGRCGLVPVDLAARNSTVFRLISCEIACGRTTSSQVTPEGSR